MTITRISVKFPSAPIVLQMMANKTRIVAHERANLNTRICDKTPHVNNYDIEIIIGLRH